MPMLMPDARRILAALTLAGAMALVHADAQDEGEAFQVLRERLTEREDENRVEKPTIVDLFGRPLALTGAYELAFDGKDRFALGDESPRGTHLFFEQEIELEAFYRPNDTWSLFSQMRLIHERDLSGTDPERASDLYVERGENWLLAEALFGSPFSIEIGTLDFEDDRLWWWDEDLDAARLTFETETFEVTLAAAREIAPEKLNKSFIDPSHDGVNRLIAEISWDWSPEHALQLFGLAQRDHSQVEKVGDRADPEREDESDADLTWLGARLIGGVELRGFGAIGYWFDAARVRGTEVAIEYEDSAEGFSTVSGVSRRRVHGWAFDAGATVLFEGPHEPRLTLAFARGSGDRNPGDGTDRSFQQTQLHGNEPGFGGSQRFQGYGELLDPELSNLTVVTAGLGFSLLRSSSLDFAYHDYRLVHAADSLRDARIDTHLTGEHRDLGESFDIILALEEWERVELEFSISALRTGDAFGEERGRWIMGGYAAFRYAF